MVLMVPAKKIQIQPYADKEQLFRAYNDRDCWVRNFTGEEKK